MFSPIFSRCVVLSVLLGPAANCRAAIITEGDAEFNGNIFVAQQEGDGSLTITAPTVLQGGGIFVADQPKFTGSVVIDGGSYEGIGNDFEIGTRGHGILEIINGGRVTGGRQVSLVVGQSSTAQGEVLVSGVGSLLSMSQGSAQIGVWGTGSFIVEEGAIAFHEQAFIASVARRPTSGKGTAIIRGAGSRWDISRFLQIGGGGTLTIQDGGLLRSSGDSSVSGIADLHGLVVAEGAGSFWRHSGNMAIQNGTQIVRAGARVVIDSLSVGKQLDSSTSIVIVEDPGSELRAGNLSLGRRGFGEVLLSSGATLTTSNAELSEGRIVLDGPGTRWLAEVKIGSININSFGSSPAELIIQNRASLINEGSIFISGIVRVSSLGSIWTANRMDISDTGLLELNQGILLNELGSRRRSTPIKNRGVVRGSGEIFGSLQNNGGGQIQVDQNQRLRIDSLENGSQGFVNIFGGELEVRSAMTNLNGGTITLFNSTSTFTIQASQSAVNHGLIVAVGKNELHGNISNDPQGSIHIHGSGRTTFHDDIVNQGTINVTTGSVATFFGDVSGNGTAGGGTVFLEAGVSPGFGPVAMVFGGNVTLGDLSELNIKIDSETHDALDIAGSATIGGELVLSVREALGGDTTLAVLSAQSVLGTFDSVPTTGEKLGFGVLFGGITYNDDSVVVSLLQQTADFNADGSVDGQDLAIFSAGFGALSGADSSTGDADRDGDVDGGDFLRWQRGFHAAAPPVVAGQIVVPEPISAALILLAMTMSVAMRRLQ